ncbi:MAG: glycine betaine ABC transporter substrate-binding protein [Nitriliruptor sp.]|nr:MAG: glycine betaine ABC transporter substrate-binding protein [Nitriliruptor sp.]
MRTTERRLRRWLAAFFVAALAMTACEADVIIDDPEAEGSLAQDYDLSGAELTVGSKEFTEQLVLGHIARIALESTGATVEDEIGLAGTAIVREALEAGEIDLYWEYTGTGWITLLGETEPVEGAEAQYEAVAERDLEQNGIRWLEPAPFDNTYAVAVHESAAEEFDLSQLSDLERLLDENPDAATFCVASEFVTRDDGLPGMEQHYGIEFPQENLVMLDEGAIYSEVEQRDNCNLGEVFATDGRIAALDLVVLEDDRDFFPAYNPSVTVRDELYQQYPQLGEMFAEIAARLDTETMQDLNARVDAEGEFPEEVAEDLLRAEGFIG